MLSVSQRLAALRERMLQAGVDAYLVPTEDFHGSEYVGEYFKCRTFITGFTGSAGTAVILADHAGLWTDGRYFLQAEAQLEGSGVTLYRMREEGVPTVEEFLEQNLKEGQVLGCDGRTLTDAKARELSGRLKKRGVTILEQLDLVGEIWEDRPPLSAAPVWILQEQYAGESAKTRIAKIREILRAQDTTHLLLTSLDDIAWLLNLRGDDIACNPVFLSYLLLGREEAVLYARETAFSQEVLAYLAELGVTLKDYFAVYEDVKTLPVQSRVWMDPDKVNFTLSQSLPREVSVFRQVNPTLLPKAIKNPTEVENMRRAHVIDAVAVTRFIYWLKTHVGKEPITELSAGEQLEAFRRQGEGYLGPSFAPIVGYAHHAAIMHYSATPQTDIAVEGKGMLLVDSGGQYQTGTTDITRTIVLGETTREEKEFFTRVLRGHLNLANAHFLYGCAGMNLDYLAREPLWEIGEDFNHGTGHGVGFVLNVHEGPNSFHYRPYPGRKAETVQEEGMITSDEPGYYLPGKFGIRHENLLVCVKAEKQPCGQFMRFDYLTLVPFDLEGILPEQMSAAERERLNAYHRQVYETIGPLLDARERAWLKDATRPI